MTIRVDPEQAEIRALLGLVNLTGQDVLEIGAGDGRLTWRYADKARKVTAVEPFAEAVARARRDRPDALASRVELRLATFRDFAAAGEPRTYDTAILAWSLCCMEQEDMIHALEEIRRLLRPDGVLIDIRPTPEASLIEVSHHGRIVFAEPEPGGDAHGTEQADRAVGHVVGQGLFVLEDDAEFDLRIYASSVGELRDFLAEANAFEGATPRETEDDSSSDIYERARKVMKTAGPGAEVVFQERARISRMRPLSRPGAAGRSC